METVWSTNDEDFGYSSLEELIDAAAPATGDTVFFGTKRVDSPVDCVSAVRVLEDIDERLYDLGGEYHDESWASKVPDEKVKELEVFLKAWAADLPPVTFFTVNDSQPYTLTEKDFK